MSKEEKQEVTETPELSVDELQKELSELKALLSEKEKVIEHTKSAQSGVDQKNTELRNEIEDLRKSLSERMTAEELKEQEKRQVQTDFENLKNELESVKSERQKEKLDAFKIRSISEAGLNPKLFDVIDGQTEDDIKNKIKLMAELESTKAEAIKKDLMNQNEPANGSGESGGITQEKFNQMSLAERTAFFKANPEAFSKFTNKRH